MLLCSEQISTRQAQMLRESLFLPDRMYSFRTTYVLFLSLAAGDITPEPK